MSCINCVLIYFMLCNDCQSKLLHIPKSLCGNLFNNQTKLGLTYFTIFQFIPRFLPQTQSRKCCRLCLTWHDCSSKVVDVLSLNLLVECYTTLKADIEGDWCCSYRLIDEDHCCWYWMAVSRCLSRASVCFCKRRFSSSTCSSRLRSVLWLATFSLYLLLKTSYSFFTPSSLSIAVS